MGFGGSCFQKDILNLVYLCKFYGLEEEAEYWHQVVKINNNQKKRFAQKVIDHFDGDLTNKIIAILGWAFKANTNDSRESASIKVSEILYKSGASITIYDPMVQKKSILNDIESLWKSKVNLNDKRIKIVKKISKTKKCDAFVIITEWEEFKNIDIEESKMEEVD